MENTLKLNLGIDDTCKASGLSRPTIMAFIRRAENIRVSKEKMTGHEQQRIGDHL